MQRFAVLRPFLEDEVPLARAAAEADVAIRTARRWLAAYRKAGLAGLVRRQEVKGLVVGLPLNLDGTQGPRAQSARTIAHALSDLGPVLLWDERWSTVTAERAMIAQDMSRAKRAERIDSHAAAVILQAAIDALVQAG